MPIHRINHLSELLPFTSKVSGVVFDAFGTLLTPISKDPYKEAIKKGWIKENPMLSKKTLPEVAPRNEANISQVKMEEVLSNVGFLPGALETLEALNAQGIPWIVCSNLAFDYVSKVSELIAPLNERELVLSCVCGLVKPNPEIFRLAAARLELPAERLLMVGDSEGSDGGAIKAGFAEFLLVPRAVRVIHPIQVQMR
jgi:HAD superfamily hydrolase (TIGR01549 family)